MTTLSASQGTVNEVRSWPREFLPDDKARGQRPQNGRRHRCQLPGREDFPYSFQAAAAPPRDAEPRAPSCPRFAAGLVATPLRPACPQVAGSEVWRGVSSVGAPWPEFLASIVLSGRGHHRMYS